MFITKSNILNAYKLTCITGGLIELSFFLLFSFVICAKTHFLEACFPLCFLFYILLITAGNASTVLNPKDKNTLS